MLIDSQPAKNAFNSASVGPSECFIISPPRTVTDMISRIRRRQVKDVDFGLTFPVMPAVPAVPAVPAPAQQTTPSQPSPQPELAPGLSTQASSTGRSSIARVTEENGVPIIRNSANDANTSAKRRKLDTDQAASSSTRSTRSSLRASRPDIYDLPEDDARESPAANIMNRPVGQDADVGQDEPKTIPEYESRPGVSQTPPSRPAPVIEEVTESPKDAPGSGHRTRLYLHEATLQSSQLLHQLQDINTTDAESIDTSPVLRRKRKRGETTPKRLVSSDERPRHSKGGQPDIEELDELSPEQLRGRSREPKQLVREKVSNVEVEEEEVAKDSTEEAEEISDHEAAAALNENRGRRISRNRAVESPDLDESSIRTPTVPQKGRGKARRISEPAQQRQPRKALQPKAKANSKTSKKASKSSKLRIGSPIPITVHRFTRRPLYDDEESDADILNSEIPYIKRGGVNPIDVLSQVCHEIIDSGLSTLEEGSNKSNDSALRREYKTKWRAVEAFGKELQDRLLEHVSISTADLSITFADQFSDYKPGKYIFSRKTGPRRIEEEAHPSRRHPAYTS